MSFSAAVSEMWDHLDNLVGSLPLPSGNPNRLPDDVVVLRGIKKEKNGIGVHQEDPIANKIIIQGQFLASIDTHLWSDESQNVVDRSRAFMTEVFNMGGTATLNGIFRKLDLTGSKGPDYFDDGKLWRMSVGINVTFEYQFEEVPGTGIINQIPVRLEGELEEDFVVG